MIKMLCLDYDNTIYDHRQQKIPESAVKALEDVQENAGSCWRAADFSGISGTRLSLNRFVRTASSMPMEH